MTTTETTNELGTTVAKDLRTVMQGKIGIGGEGKQFWTDRGTAEAS